MAVHTLGGVVTPAQQLMVIVPHDHPLEVEAWIENKDVGFVSAGQSVEVKIDTFPFTTYGTVSEGCSSFLGMQCRWTGSGSSMPCGPDSGIGRRHPGDGGPMP